MAVGDEQTGPGRPHNPEDRRTQPLPIAGTKSTRGVYARWARRMTAPRSSATPLVLEPLLRVHQRYHPRADTPLLARAYHLAEEKHRGVFRKSGDPYITHPLAVATICAEMGMDTTTLVAALLHDTVEDTDYTIEQLAADFGDVVAHLVDGVTKLDKVKFGETAEAETIRKMIAAMAKDPRVLVIKVADRLHNMRTMRFLRPEKQAKKARETLEVIAPLAHRLGMATIKWELEDLAFAILEPKKYQEIVRLVADRAPSRDTYITTVKATLDKELKGAHLQATVDGRPKHYWSIYQKMMIRGRAFDEIHDLVGIRILCDSVRDCYAAVGVVHSLWAPMPGRFKDYIAAPRFGVYQSLHTSVMGPEGKPLEVQVRTHEMHHAAEYGIAAHWRYKETKGRHDGDGTEIDEVAYLRQLLSWQAEAEDPSEFLDNLRFAINSKDIFVFTPKGKAITLPQGATPVDFAYAVHTEVGHRCIGAKVDGKLVSLEKPLANGATVEIFTAKDAGAGPSRDWQNFVVTGRAKTAIRQWFAKERRSEALERGKEQIAREIRRSGAPVHRLFSNDSLTSVARELSYSDVTALYTAVGEGHVSAAHVLSRLVADFGGSDEVTEELAERSSDKKVPRSKLGGQTTASGVLVDGLEDVVVKLARCCTPVPGDEILGFVTRTGTVSVHRTDCPNTESLRKESERFVKVEWSGSQTDGLYLVAVQVEALDRQRLLSDITKAIADEKVNILSATLQMRDDNRVTISKYTFEMANPAHLGQVLNSVRKVEGVYDAYRVTNAAG
ncbi:RelA/SpoT family protein [Dietzia sp.]|uniref:RelA/SpoT family protein n=1 Tax=Dietzia sp. TaxID=1871616 RepID=UPI002FD97688